MLRNFWKHLRAIITVVCAFFLFFFVIEIIRAYQTLYQLHPLVGILFIILLCSGLIWLFSYFLKNILSKPPVLIPPKIKDPSDLSDRELFTYGKYLTKYLNRLNSNENLSDEEREKANLGVVTLTMALKSKNDKETIRIAIEKTEEEFVNPLLKTLDDKAETHIQNCVRDVMLGTILSPYKAADLLIVLYRNFLMIKQIIFIYNSRPRFREQMKIILDTITVVATVNCINMGKNLLECLGSRVPIVGKYMDDLAQGVGAGLMTSVTGHSALGRCQAFKGWNEQEAKQSIYNNLGIFYKDIKNIFKEDVWEKVGNVLGIPGETFEKVKDSILEALDEADKGIRNCVKKPVIVLASGVSGGNTLIKNIGSKIHTIGSKLYEGTKEKSPIVADKFKTVGGKIGNKGLSLGKSGLKAIGNGLSVSGKFTTDKTSKIVSHIKNRNKEVQGKDETTNETSNHSEEQQNSI